jgi:hypothetical protein
LSQASKKKMKFVPTSNKVVRNAKEISFIFLAMIAIYLVIALFTFHPADSGWSQAASTDVVHNIVVSIWILRVSNSVNLCF